MRVEGGREGGGDVGMSCRGRFELRSSTIIDWSTRMESFSAFGNLMSSLKIVNWWHHPFQDLRQGVIGEM